MTEAAQPSAELSSIATALDELARRVTEIAERSTGTKDDWLAAELFQVERSLGEARRRMASIDDRIRR
ncbi:MAG: hypothetical protein ABR540_09590 [Acidimicrobiales bacterium]|nr:hypothetical protein [Actinomycetota bacterium]